MVRLTKWEDVDKSLAEKTLPKIISAKELEALRAINEVFLGRRTDAEAHQCWCGNLFFVTVGQKSRLSVDKNGEIQCNIHEGEDSKDRAWRERFNLHVQITDAMDAYGHSRPDQKQLAFEKVRALAEGTFPCRNVKEMHVGYWKLQQSLIEGNEPSLQKDDKLVMDDLFQEARKSNLPAYVKLVNPEDVDSYDEIDRTVWGFESLVGRMEKDYFLERLSQFPILVRPTSYEELEKNRLRAYLLFYSHLVELNPLYAITLNLVRSANGQEYAKDPFRGVELRTFQKIAAIKKENSKVGALLERFCSNKLRNAFAHSRYRIQGDFIIKTDENWKITIPSFYEKLSLCRTYWSYLKRKMVEGVISLYEDDILRVAETGSGPSFFIEY
jgi:hypothetical protein